MKAVIHLLMTKYILKQGEIFSSCNFNISTWNI